MRNGLLQIAGRIIFIKMGRAKCHLIIGHVDAQHGKKVYVDSRQPLNHCLMAIAHETGHAWQTEPDARCDYLRAKQRLSMELDAWNRARHHFGKTFWWDEDYVRESLLAYKRAFSWVPCPELDHYLMRSQ